MREIRDLTVSTKPSQSTRDSCTITTTDNSTNKKSTPGTKTDKKEGKIQQSSNKRSVTPFNIQDLTVFQREKGRRWERYSIPTDPEDPQSAPASSMGSSKVLFNA